MVLLGLGLSLSHGSLPKSTPLASLLHGAALTKCALASAADEQIQMVESTVPRGTGQLLKDIALERTLFCHQ